MGACFSSDMSALENSLVLDCGKDEYCLTDMEVDWLPMGDQITTIRRRCATEEIVPKCETSVSNGWAMTTCLSPTCSAITSSPSATAVNLTSSPLVPTTTRWTVNCRQKTKLYNRVPCGLLPPVLSLTPSSAPK